MEAIAEPLSMAEQQAKLLEKLDLSGLKNWAPRNTEAAKHPLHLVGLGGNRMQPLGFVILRVQVKEITRYNEDIVFLIVTDGSDFSRRVPLVIGTCTLSRMVNVIKESELDMLSPPWVVVHASRLLSIRQGTATSDDKGSGNSQPRAICFSPRTQDKHPSLR